MAWVGRTLLALSALLLASCASPTLRTTDVEGQIADGLAEQVGGGFAVTCPTSVPAEAGTGFTCSVTDETTGDRLSVLVSIEDDAGAFSWRMGPMATPTAAP